MLGDRIEYAKKPMEAVDGADALLVITEWSEFRHPDLDELKQRLSAPVIFDGRNIFAADKMDEAGFTYFGIGTGTR